LNEEIEEKNKKLFNDDPMPEPKPEEPLDDSLEEERYEEPEELEESI
jgi:hypothetical protein